MKRAPWLLLILLFSLGVQAEVPYLNFENHPQQAIALSPDGSRLAVAHSADQRVQWFAIGSTGPVAAGHTVVGFDPVAVRFRTAGELWVVNHLSDSISIVDVERRQVVRTLFTGDEPFDVVFAGGRAFVTCSQVNQVWVFDLADLDLPPRVLDIAGEDPRALAVSADGRQVAVAIFESGNASTVLPGGFDNTAVVSLPNAVSDSRGPYGGQNPPPNAGAGFDPPLNPMAVPPKVGLIVRRDEQAVWRDDNGMDWTRFVSGDLSTVGARRQGWDLPDNDIALIDVASLQISYARGLMNIGMAISARPGGGFTLVGSEAQNQIRFEPKVRGVFVQMVAANIDALGNRSALRDLNPHLTYQTAQLPVEQRRQSLADPRAIVWQADGARGWVAGLGSNNIIEIDARLARVGAPITVGNGPIGLVLDEARQRLYVWNHFAAELVEVDLASRSIHQRLAAFDPLPAAIRQGRDLFYNGHRTSGLGQASCAACHIDGRTDRLAWDLGDPSHAPAAFDQNCITRVVRRCEDFHAMKGPMTTQTLQDIIGHEPHHWRGDRAGIEAFNPAFVDLLGRDSQLTAAEMQQFEDFLATIHFPPNPNRNPDNSLPRALSLQGHYTSGRFAMIGQPLGVGDALRGLVLYTQGLLDPPFQCASCHTLPTGMAANGPLLTIGNFSAGGSVMAHGSKGENHLGIVSVDGSTNVSIKVPHLRNQHEKVGYESTQLQSLAGFGFLHDGSVDSLSRFLSAQAFQVASDQDVADLVALMLAFGGGDFGIDNPQLGAPAPASKDAHAGLGRQAEHSGGPASDRLNGMFSIARTGKLDLVVRANEQGYFYQTEADRFLAADGITTHSFAELLGLASASNVQTWTLQPTGLGRRLALDRDGDGIADALELKQGSDPADGNSKTLRPAAGLWFNPARDGHGFDLQFADQVLALTWYTYNEDGSPTWYQASAPFATPWQAELLQYRWNSALNQAEAVSAGSVTLAFTDARNLQFDWRIGSRSGSEPMRPLLESTQPAVPNRTGIYYDAEQPGWGLSIYTEGSDRGALMYFYDGSGAPRWVLGLGDNRISDESLSMQSFAGFCPHCPAIPANAVAGGSIRWRFTAARALQLDSDVFSAAAPAQHWQRQQRALTPLSSPVKDPRWH